ncbi:MAG: FHA domain-containing protein [Nannocystaceae bacterium]
MLEEAGDLQEAARLYEHAGEHEHAATLRLEYANTLSDENERLSALRQACVHTREDGEASLALHGSLADTLRERSSNTADAMEHNALRRERAQHLQLAGRGTEAGSMYEALDDLPRAAQAYEAAGAITELELVYARLESNEKLARTRQELVTQIDHAWRSGQRRRAGELLRAAVRGSKEGARDTAALRAQAEHLHRSTPRAQRLVLRWCSQNQPAQVVHVHTSARLVVGRSPTADIAVSEPDLSRSHAAVELDPSGTSLIVRDLGSRSGTFWHGIPVDPDSPGEIHDGGELGLGVATTFEIIPGEELDSEPTALIRPVGDMNWWLFAPHGGPLRLAPQQRAPATIRFRDPFFCLTLDADTEGVLNSEHLLRGGQIELLIGDELRLGDPARAVELEVCA